MRYLFFLFAIWFLNPLCNAQRADTTFLKEVTIYGLPILQYATGSKIERIYTDNTVTTLSDALSTETSIYLKNYGNNQLSTLALRGTTASQTAILWNGININSPTLGQTDLSLIPMFLFDEASLHYGTSSALYGTDAIGGSIMLGQSQPQFTKAFKILLSQQAGSFGKSASGVKMNYGNEKLQLKTILYNSSIKNNFKYNAPAVGFEKTQNHAEVKNYGFDQQVFYKITPKQIISGEGMYTSNFREIQPVVTNDEGNTSLQDRHVRARVSYQNNLSVVSIHATTAYILSDQDYTNDLTTNVKSKQFSTLLNLDHSLSGRSNLRYGFNFNYYTASSENYKNIKDNRFDMFASYRYAIKDRWVINLNIRQAWYDSKYAPLAPTMGSEAIAYQSKKQKIVIRAQAGRGYRVPTINDRYWQPGGNPFLKPEESFQTEGGLNWNYNTTKINYQIGATHYQSWLQKMIVWMPANQIWTPINLQRVHIKGLEVFIKSSLAVNLATLNTGVSYSYTQSKNKEGLRPGDQTTDEKQLPYIPFHSGKMFFNITFKTWSFNGEYFYNGLRYTTLDNTDYQSLDNYALLNFSTSKKININKWHATLKAEARNVLGIYYENLENNAMPGRSYLISLIITN